MARNQVSDRDVRKAYGEIKALMPGLDALYRDEFFKTWHIGQVRIGATAREAKATLTGMQLGVRFYSMAGGK